MKEKFRKGLKTALWLVPLLALTVMIDRSAMRMFGDRREQRAYAERVQSCYTAVFTEEAPAMQALYDALQQTIAQPDAARYADLQQAVETATTAGQTAFGQAFSLADTVGAASFFYWGGYLLDLQADVTAQRTEWLPDYAAILERQLQLYPRYALPDGAQAQDTGSQLDALRKLYAAMSDSELTGPIYRLIAERSASTAA